MRDHDHRVARSPLPYIAGNWYPATVGSFGISPVAGANIGTTITRLAPFDVRRRVTITDLGTRITTLSAGGNVRLGIYASDPTTGKATGTPLGSVVLSTAAASTVSAALSSSIELAPGRLYWLAAQVDNATAVCQAQASAGCLGSLALGDSSLANANQASNGGFMVLTASVAYASGLTDLTAVAQTPANTIGYALGWFKVAA